MGLRGEPLAAVSGNASEVPDSESGEFGNPASVEFANESVDLWTEQVLTPSTEAQIATQEEGVGNARQEPGPA